MGPERGPCASGSDVCAQVRTVAQDVATPAPAPAPFRGKYPPKTPSPRAGAETLAAAPGTAPDLAGPGPGAAAVPESSGRRSGDAVPPDSEPATSGSASGTTADTPATPQTEGTPHQDDWVGNNSPHMGPERGPCASGSDVCAQVRTVAQDVATPAPAPFRGKYPPKTPSPREGAETLAAAPVTAPDLAGPGPGAAAVP